MFRQLETAANEASFCSESSRIQDLVSEAVLPSPARGQRSAVSFVSSTPAPVVSSTAPEPALEVTEEEEEPTLGQSIMLDIKKFLQERLSSEQSGGESGITALSLVESFRVMKYFQASQLRLLSARRTTRTGLTRARRTLWRRMRTPPRSP